MRKPDEDGQVFTLRVEAMIERSRLVEGRPSVRCVPNLRSCEHARIRSALNQALFY
jgi:hypothetical protein